MCHTAPKVYIDHNADQEKRGFTESKFRPQASQFGCNSFTASYYVVTIVSSIKHGFLGASIPGRLEKMNTPTGILSYWVQSVNLRVLSFEKKHINATSAGRFIRSLFVRDSTFTHTTSVQLPAFELATVNIDFTLIA